MSKRIVKPKVMYFWQWNGLTLTKPAYRVKWLLVNDQGVTLCESSDDYETLALAKEALANVVGILGSLFWIGSQPQLGYREVGPGKKPQA